MIKAVLFDLDGTLLNRDASVRCFIENQYERLKSCLSNIDKETYIERFLDLDARGYVWKDKVYQQLVKELGLSCCAEKLLADYIAEFRHHCVSYSHLHSMLQQLKNMGLKLGIISNGFGQFQLDNIKALGIEKEFDGILISEWEGIKKPDPVIFKRALDKLEVAAAESIFVGDHPINDVQAAKQVGMIGVWKRDEWWEEYEIKADYVVDELSGIPRIIASLGNDSSSIM